MRMVLVDEVAMLGTLNFIEQSVRLFIACPQVVVLHKTWYNGRFTVE